MIVCCTVIIKNFQTSEFFKVLLTLVLIINWAHICKLHSPYYYWLLLFFMTYFVVGIYTRLPVWGGIISLDLNREKCVRMLVQLTCEQNWFLMGQIVLISMQSTKKGIFRTENRYPAKLAQDILARTTLARTILAPSTLAQNPNWPHPTLAPD